MPTVAARHAVLLAACLAAPRGPAAPPAPNPPAAAAPDAGTTAVAITGAVRDAGGNPLGGATVTAARAADGQRLGTASTDAQGRYHLIAAGVRAGDSVAVAARRVGYVAQRVVLAAGGDTLRADFSLAPSTLQLEQATVAAAGALRSDMRRRRTGQAAEVDRALPAPPPRIDPAQYASPMAAVRALPRAWPRRGRPAAGRFDREQYDRIDENPFVSVAAAPRSTSSLDVDRASYANVRRMLREGETPPADAVRIEEFVNYFPYHLPDPPAGEALGVSAEVAPAPWRPGHELVRVALQARRPDPAALPPSNLVFLVDVSGSMFEPNKLPLVKQALGVLVARLRPEDRVSLVAYAGNAGLVLPSTSGADKARILAAIDRLEAGGSTAGGAGLELAYRVAREHARAGVNSRVILATDGDFNVGPSSDAEMERLIEAKRAEGTYLTVLGFGEGNLQDAKMKKLAKRGNGNYAYVDDLAEAQKVFGQELGGTLVTVANDAKLQVEFNPAAVRAYRLIGYEGRLLRDEDFADDAKDAGDVGAGHAVTALYEVIPAGAPAGDTARGVGPLRYAAPPRVSAGRGGGELLYVQLRYKRPGEATSRLVTLPVRAGRGAMSADFRFASAVAEFGMLLRGSAHRGHASAGQVLALAGESLGDDPGGHRREFVELVRRWAAVRGDMVARAPE